MANCWLKGREKGRAPQPLSQCRLPWLVLTQGSLPIAILAQANLAQAILAQAILAESTSCTAGRVWGELLALALVRVAPFPVVYSNRSAGLQAGSLYTCESPLSGIYSVSRSAGRSVSQSVGGQVVRSSNHSVGRAAQQSIGKAVVLIDRSAGRSAGLPLLRARPLGRFY